MGSVHAINSGVEIASPGKPDADVVALLERWLKKARDGEICCVAGALEYSDGSSGSAFAGGRVTARMLGEVEIMKAELLKSF